MFKVFQRVYKNIKVCSVVLTLLLISCLYIKYFNITNSFLYKLYFNNYFLYYILSSIVLYAIRFSLLLYQKKRKLTQNIYSQLKLFIASLGMLLVIIIIIYDLYQAYVKYGFMNIMIFTLFVQAPLIAPTIKRSGLQQDEVM